MRVPIGKYLDGERTRVYSYVVAVPFSPIDIDITHLTRGEWNAAADRFRLWYMPGDGAAGSQLCYLVVRKFDPRTEVLVYMHIVVSLNAEGGAGRPSFMMGVLSNDDVRSKAALNAIVGIPPVFHRRTELRVVEHRWRTDPEAVLRFTANAHSVLAGVGPGAVAFNLKFELPPGITDEFRRNLGAWWPSSDGGASRVSRLREGPGSSGLGRPVHSGGTPDESASS